KSRAEAKRLLKEAGIPDGYAFTFKNRGIPMPYEPVGVWLIDQWRQVGLNVKQEVIEAAKYYAELRGGNFDVAMDFQCGYIVEPDLDLYKFQSKDKSPANYSRYTDLVLDELVPPARRGRAAAPSPPACRHTTGGVARRPRRRRPGPPALRRRARVRRPGGARVLRRPP